MSGLNRVMFYIVHNFFKIIAFFVFHFLYRLKQEGTENIPKKGGFIAMPNHASYWDPPLTGVTHKRYFHFMARSTLFIPVWGMFLRWMGAFPVKRGKIDRDSWSNLYKLVRDGWPVVFFPEGTRTEDGEIQKGKPGTGMIIYNARVPVVPVYLHGTREAWPKGQKTPKFFKKLHVIYGKPIHFDEYYSKEAGREVYEAITEKVMSEIKAMKDRFLKAEQAEKR
ncbi:MAG TPA: 1-acyl-sn-glycerol-3-phosphate acyltransferase [bacterium]|nr:1-acyl-sn-glycerol-3-phosphate acyltransferase [bacterium]